MYPQDLQECYAFIFHWAPLLIDMIVFNISQGVPSMHCLFECVMELLFSLLMIFGTELQK